MLRNLIVSLFFSAVVAVSTVPTTAMTLPKSGETAYTIVTSARATAPEQTAVKELQDYLKQVTGADFPIKLDDEARVGAPKILVGQSAQVRRLLPEVEWKSMAHDGIIIKTVGNDPIIAGGRPHGALLVPGN